MTKYRIVKDMYCGYKVQIWRWWFPFWVQPVINTHTTVEDAEKWAYRHKNEPYIAKHLGSLDGTE